MRLFRVVVGWWVVALASCVDDGSSLDDGDDGVEAPPAPPAAPTALSVSSGATTSLQLSWTGVTGATEYVIYRGAATNELFQYTANSPATATTFTDSNLTPNTKYCYAIKDVVGGAESAFSNIQCNTTQPLTGTPTNLKVVVNSAPPGFTVSWNGVSRATSYYVLSRVGINGPFAVIDTVTNATTATISTVTAKTAPGAVTQFEVEATNGMTTSLPSAPVSATIPDTQLQTWYKFDDKTGTTAADSSGNGHTATLGTRNMFTTDHAPFEDGSGHNPSALDATSIAMTLPTTVLTSFLPTAAQAVEFWVKPLGSGSYVFLEEGTTCPGQWQIGMTPGSGVYISGTSTTTGTTNSLATNKGLVANTWNHIAISDSGSASSTTLTIFINGSAATTGTDPAATGSNISIGRCDPTGQGYEIDDLRFYSRTITATEAAETGARPGLPTSPKLTTDHSKRAELSWTAPSPTANGVAAAPVAYFVYRGTASGAETYLTSTDATTFDAQDLTPNTKYFFEVYGINQWGEVSGASAEVSGTTLAAPPAPTGLTATINRCCTPNRIDLKWSAVTRAVSYAIFQSTDGVTFSHIGSVTSTDTAYEAANLDTATTYYYEIEAEDDSNTYSAPSAIGSATTN